MERTLSIPLWSRAIAGCIRQYDFACEIKEYLASHPETTVAELGAGLSCLRRQMKNEANPWMNVDFPDVIACREKHIPKGEKEKLPDVTVRQGFFLCVHR